jgi:hypothetical protein
VEVGKSFDDLVDEKTNLLVLEFPLGLYLENIEQGLLHELKD